MGRQLMHKRGRILTVAVACGAVAYAFAGCASKKGSDAFTAPEAGTFGDGSAPNCFHCSADLHQVLDCNDTPLTTCPGDKGCGGGGACVDPCEAAKANGSTVGCDFYAATVGPENDTRGSCYAVLVANTWTSPVSITADYGGAPLDIGQIARIPQGSGTLSYEPLNNGQLDPGKLAVLFLSSYPSGDQYHVSCPAGITPGISDVSTAVDGTGIGKAFHITTTAPIVAYDIYPYGGAASAVSSASLLVPTPAWGTNYMAVAAFKDDPDQAVANSKGFPYLQVIASEDATQVTISPTKAIAAGTGVAGTGKGQPVKYTLEKGQVLHIQQPDELSGSPISSDKPVSVIGGSSCMRIPVGVEACDSGHQQLVPVSMLGSTYIAVHYAERDPGVPEATPWRIVGAVDGTQLTYDPPLGDAPTTLASGQLIELDTTTPFVVRSQDDKHPFYMSGHMTGCKATTSGKQGDPDFVNVVPPPQFLRSYLFLTDPTYKNTNLVFTRGKGTDGSTHDVTLDCAGTITGWQPLGGSGFEYARIDLVRDGNPVGQCANGVHTATSDAAFGLTVWGWDSAVSYAYPAGMSVHPINTVVVPPVPK